MSYQYAGGPDPNGVSYNGTGYTGTLLAHGVQTTAAKVQPGDIVVYGPGAGNHAAVVVAVTSNGIVTVSHGQEKGPILISVHDEAQYQPPGIRYLSWPL